MHNYYKSILILDSFRFSPSLIFWCFRTYSSLLTTVLLSCTYQTPKRLLLIRAKGRGKAGRTHPWLASFSYPFGSCFPRSRRSARVPLAPSPPKETRRERAGVDNQLFTKQPRTNVRAAEQRRQGGEANRLAAAPSHLLERILIQPEHRTSVPLPLSPRGRLQEAVGQIVELFRVRCWLLLRCAVAGLD